MNSEQELAACLEEIARAARCQLADPTEPAWRDRLSTATADAFAIIHDCPRPRRAITVEELLAGDPVVTVGTDPSEAAAPWYNLHPHKRPGPLPESTTLNGEGMSLSDQVLRDRGHTEDEIRGLFSGPGEDITSKSMADLEAGKTFSWDEWLSKFDAGPHWDEVLASLEMDRAMATQGLNKETRALLTLLGLSSQDVEAGRVSPYAEVLSAIRNGDPIKERIREHMRGKHQTPLQSEVERLQARVKQLVGEALAEAPMNPAELRQAVIRKLALDLDTEADPSMDEIQAEV